MRVYVFDIDGTICTNTFGEYDRAKPFSKRIEYINHLYDLGNIIIFQTARGMGSSENDVKIAAEQWRDFTITQLKNWGVSYHKLFFGKPAGDIYIDDKGQDDIMFFKDR